MPPNNQGNATPEYNTLDGEGPVKPGVGRGEMVDRYTAQTVEQLRRGYVSFAGPARRRLLRRHPGDLRSADRCADPGKDSQKGYNVHTIVLQIPVDEIGGDMQIAGVHATTMRQQVELRSDRRDPLRFGRHVQVGRQGNPLFCEGFVALADKDRYNRTSPDRDAALFSGYAVEPELARLLNAIVFKDNPIDGIETGRTDIAGIFIPDVIKVDLSTCEARLAGGGADDPNNPDDMGFSRLSVFGGDTLWSPLQQTMVAGGWPNGRRFGDDVVDIGVSAVISDLRVNPPVIRVAGDNVDSNDVAYNRVMPYAGPPLNGRNHKHDD